MEKDRQNPYLNVGEAAAYLWLERRTLDNMRWMAELLPVSWALI